MTQNILHAAEAQELALSLGLLQSEYDHIVHTLQRTPTRTELAVFAGMWSEHCSYKSTLQWLKTLPKEGEHILAGPGSHAGVVAVSDAWAVAFKIESHNHPSAVEPYQGAATGVGGILRDIVAQGARPCAVMDSLCFGLPGDLRNNHLIEGVVAGIAGYGNAFGVPNVGGRTVYDARYGGNILVNALAAGLQRRDGLRAAQGAQPGDLVLYAGAATGRDGILGAAFASEELGEDTVEDRPHVQVGDPFTGKKLMEACISFTPHKGNRAGQDMGAAGITCAAFEIAAASGVGIEIDLETIPLREEGMAPQEIMLSESQERFMYVVTPQKADEAVEHFRQHGVHAVICGRIVEGARGTVFYRGETVVDLPAALVADGCPPTQWPLADALPPVEPYPPFEMPAELGAELRALLADANIAYKEKLYGRYDQTVGNRTVRGPDQATAAVLKLPEGSSGFALTITSRGDLCAIDPFLGAQATVAEAMRKLACAGAEMVAITDGLNVASPRDPVENLKLERTIAGLGEGLRQLGVPVTGGNCSLYNESQWGPIPPTPMVGALGLVENVRQVPTHRLPVGARVVLLGNLPAGPVASRYGYMMSNHVPVGDPPAVDLAAEKKLAQLLVSAVRRGWIRSARDVSVGGAAVALAKLALHGAHGVEVSVPVSARADWSLFGEGPACAWVVVDADHADALLDMAHAQGVPATHAGIVAGERLRIRSAEGTMLIDEDLERLAQAYEIPWPRPAWDQLGA